MFTIIQKDNMPTNPLFSLVYWKSWHLGTDAGGPYPDVFTSRTSLIPGDQATFQVPVQFRPCTSIQGHKFRCIPVVSVTPPIRYSMSLSQSMNQWTKRHPGFLSWHMLNSHPWSRSQCPNVCKAEGTLNLLPHLSKFFGPTVKRCACT